ncbi:MAG TPA: nuclear transport factor 2 family protein [Luteimonas sp.]|nr:nuclear transport factor 2 family protein [Luteimonas sp.]
MSANDDRDARDGVLDTLARITAAWRGRDFDALPALFAPDVVMALPGLSGYLEGREACVDSFREFTADAQVDRYAESAHRVDVSGDTAVASYRWEMAWTRAGHAHAAAGHDLFVLRREGDRWLVTWRTLLADA